MSRSLLCLSVFTCFSIALLCLCFFACFPSSAGATDFYVFYLGGQSNMDGYGQASELPADLQGEVERVPIFHGNKSADCTPVDGRGMWTTLRPGHGFGFKSDGKKVTYSDRIGIELTFAWRLQELLPDKRIALIKYSRGGTSIDEDAAGRFGCWEPDFEQGEGEGHGINQYDHFLATIRYAMSDSDINDDGETDRLIPAGIIWMQGESDAAYTAGIADRYEAHLKRLMDLMRAALRSDDLPVVIGRISDSGQDDEDGQVWEHGDTIRTAQAAFVEKDGHAALVTSTDEYGYSDRWHYDTAGYIDLGQQFAEAWLSISEMNMPQQENASGGNSESSTDP
ncbi:MAG: sialate O-acetylesterase [Planctomycetaceae bacterium]